MAAGVGVGGRGGREDEEVGSHGGGALRLSPLSRRSAPRRCGTNRSCACVAIVVITVGALVSQAEEQMDGDKMQ